MTTKILLGVFAAFSLIDGAVRLKTKRYAGAALEIFAGVCMFVMLLNALTGTAQ